MSCLCQKIAGKHFELSPICLRQLWMFDNLAPAEVAALTKEAERKKLEKGQVLFMQSDPAEELFLIKRGRVKLVPLADIPIHIELLYRF